MTGDLRFVWLLLGALLWKTGAAGQDWYSLPVVSLRSVRIPFLSHLLSPLPAFSQAPATLSAGHL